MDYRTKNESDSAFQYFNKAKDVYSQQNNKLGTGKCLLNMAIISTDKGDFFGAQEFSLNAISYFDKKNPLHHIYIKSIFNNLGIVSYALKNYDQAINFYQQTLEYNLNSDGILTVENNVANAYRREMNYRKALTIYTHILKKKISTNEFARTLSNFAYTKWLENPNYNAAPELLKALQIREGEKDLKGLNTSYAQLADYYTNIKPQIALRYATKMYLVAKKINNPADQLEALQKLVKLSPQVETKKYFERYQNLEDSVQTVRNTAKNQFALIRYETEKNKADFLKAQADNVQKQNDILRKNIVLVILAAGLVSGYFWYRKRQRSLQQEKRIEVKNTELKYVKKIHDSVANKVYQVISEVENAAELDKQSVLNKLESIYDVSRDISYEDSEIIQNDNFAKQLAKMLKSYSSEKIELFIIGNDDAIWEDVEESAKAEILYILQELMTNMKKHSKAGSVVLKFKKSDQLIDIFYSDNGIGIKNFSPGNGIRNTGTRIDSIHGEITFDTETEKGLKIHISFPFS